MTVEEMIVMLKKYPKKAIVRAWDADDEQFNEVSGAIFEDGGHSVDLQTDIEP